MKLEEIKQHWASWADEYTTDVRATTRTPTIKKLEIDAIYRAILEKYEAQPELRILEVGCGNGTNCIELSKRMPKAQIDGVDYIPKMIESAKTSISTLETGNLRFFEGDILKLGELTSLRQDYDVVFTNRCIINLNSHDMQAKALAQLANKAADHALLLLLENQICSHARQNELREAIELPSREAAEFNLFMDQATSISKLSALGFEHLKVSNFASLHDVLLYVLIPKAYDGQNIYDHPLMDAVTELCLSRPDIVESFGDFGQNQLLVFQRCQK